MDLRCPHITDMRDLDGASAGGQFVRTALALSALENEPVRLQNVRGARSQPGLRPQHLAVLETIASICDGNVTGAALGSETVTFESGHDGEIPGGTYAVDIDTAGSISLLFDAVLALAPALEEPLTVTATGGTDVAWSPPIEYLTRIKLPLLREFGLCASCEIERRGFYPAGGGRATLRLVPSTLEPIELEKRGPVQGVRCYSTEAAALADSDVASRQAVGAIERLTETDREASNTGQPSDDSPAVLLRQLTTAVSDCPGSAIVLRLEYDGGVAGFSALGERGTPAERVGADAADAANRFLESNAVVDQYLADQLLVFLALAGGRIRIPSVTEHVESSLALLEAFGISLQCHSAGESVIVSDEQ